jgi:hypothetical protein
MKKPLASIQGFARFVDSYESVNARQFTEDEREVAWAASLLPSLHARGLVSPNPRGRRGDPGTSRKTTQTRWRLTAVSTPNSGSPAVPHLWNRGTRIEARPPLQ